MRDMSLLFICIVLMIFFGALALPITIGVVVHLIRKSKKEKREHPEWFENKKRDNFCYWTK